MSEYLGNLRYTDRTPGCVTAMTRNLHWDTLEECRHSSRLQMLYKIQHGLVDINKDSYMKQSDSRTSAPTDFSKKEHHMKCTTTPSSQELSGTGTSCHFMLPLPTVWRSSDQDWLLVLLSSDLQPAAYLQF